METTGTRNTFPSPAASKTPTTFLVATRINDHQSWGRSGEAKESWRKTTTAKHWTRAQRSPLRRERTQRLLTSLMCISKDVVKRHSLPSGDKHSMHSPLNLPNSIVQGLQREPRSEERPWGLKEYCVFPTILRDMCNDRVRSH